MTADDREQPRLHHRRATRIVLTLLFLIHWGSVAAFLLPVDPASLAPLPPPARAPLAAVIPLAYRSWPVARQWLDATSTRQRWTLFAPDPADWSADVEVVEYYLTSAAGQPPRFEARSVEVAGPADDPLPHWTEHRPYRIVFNLGYDQWGAFYRPLFARRICRDHGSDGKRPAGVALTVRWEPLDPPWADSVRAPERQRLGGWSCWELLGEPPPDALAP